MRESGWPAPHLACLRPPGLGGGRDACRTRWCKTYQTNPQLNAERARQRGTDENVPQALAGYRPQTGREPERPGLQAVRNILPDNTVQSATLKPWTIGLTVTQILFNGYKTANNVRVAEFQVKSGREALRNIEQGVLLDAVTAYMNVMANYALVEAQRTNVAGAARNPGDDQDGGSMPATSRRPIRRRRSRGSAAGSPISTPRKSRLRSARRSTSR